MFLFAVGYGVGPQFVRGVAKEGMPQAIFAVVQCLFCLLVPVGIAKIAGYDLGYAAGLYSGSQTISAAMGLSTDAINRLGLAADQTKSLLNSMPIAYAVTYIFGTVGSALVIALLGPALLRINLVTACKDYEEKHGGSKELGGPGSAWHRWEVRAFRLKPGGKAVGLRAIEAEAMLPDARIFVLRVRHNGVIEDATADTVLSEGDVVALAGAREALLRVVGEGGNEVEDPELLSVPVEGVDILVTNKAVDGKTLAELGQLPAARGVFLRKITRGATATNIPILPNTQIYRGDLLTIVGRTQDTTAAAKLLGVADRPTDVADVAFIGGAITIGALFGALVLKIHGVPLTLSTAGGALIAGLVFGWLRSVRPLFGRIPSPTVWFMNSVGLNIFIAVVGISAGPGFVNGLKTQGVSLFLWGAAGDYSAPCSRHVRWQVHFPFPRCAVAWNRFRGAHHDCFARLGLRSGPKPGSGARLHRHLRRRQHSAHDMGHGPHHPAVVTNFDLNRSKEKRNEKSKALSCCCHPFVCRDSPVACFRSIADFER